MEKSFVNPASKSRAGKYALSPLSFSRKRRAGVGRVMRFRYEMRSSITWVYFSFFSSSWFPFSPPFFCGERERDGKCSLDLQLYDIKCTWK